MKIWILIFSAALFVGGTCLGVALQPKIAPPPPVVPESSDLIVAEESVTEPEQPARPIVASNVFFQGPMGVRSRMPAGSARSRPEIGRRVPSQNRLSRRSVCQSRGGTFVVAEALSGSIPHSPLTKSPPASLARTSTTPRPRRHSK